LSATNEGQTGDDNSVDYDKENKILTCWENTTVTVTIPNADEYINDLDSINQDLYERKITDYKPFEILKNNKIRTTQYVGLIQVSDHTIQILPKVSSKFNKDDALKNVLIMLLYSNNLSIYERKLSELANRLNTIVEGLIFFYALGLEKALAQGINKTYVTQEYNSKYLRGQLIMEKEAAKIDKSYLWIRTSDYVEDNELNQFLKAATRRFIPLTQNPEIRMGLRRVLSYLVDVSDLKIENIKYKNMTFNRLNASYEPSYRLAKLILEKSAIAVSRKKTKFYNFLIDMNKLFQEFVANFMNANWRSLGHANTQLVIQGDGINRYYFGNWHLDKREDYQLIPDLIIRDTEGTPLMIMDTKYKQVDDKDSDRPKTTPEDLYQLYAYLQKINCKKGLIIYPSYRETKLYEDHFEFDNNHLLFFSKVNLDFGENWEDDLLNDIRKSLRLFYNS
jgi:5-methylcytosine-specific restriction enzyme subunit McrC